MITTESDPGKDYSLRHPHTRLPQVLPGSLWAITTFFNPAGYKNKKENFDIFRKQSKLQGLKLIAIELAFDDTPFELSKDEDADMLVRLRGSTENILWQKERLLNIGRSLLPADCDKVVWIDCDIVFDNDGWIAETAKLLETYAVVQPFTHALILDKGSNPDVKIDLEAMEYGFKDGMKAVSRGYAIEKYQSGEKIPPANFGGHVGFVWAIRREIIDAAGFFDKTPFFGADSLHYYAFTGDKSVAARYLSHAMIATYEKWTDEIYSKVQGSISYASGNIRHLWHGIYKERNYGKAGALANEFDFNPDQDIALDDNGLWKWSSNKLALHDKIKEYFHVRKEDAGYIVVKGVYGLANRIYTILSALMYGKITGRDVVIDWTDGMYAQKGVDAFRKIFDGLPSIEDNFKLKEAAAHPAIWTKNLDKNFYEMMALLGDRSEFPYQAREKLSVDVTTTGHEERVVVFFDYALRFYLLKEGISKKGLELSNSRRCLSALLKEHVILKQDIRREIDEFKKNHFKGKVIGVHVRHTDNLLERFKEFGLATSPRMIEDAVDLVFVSHLDEGTPTIFLSTDNEDILEHYKKKYPKVISVDKFYPSKKQGPIHSSDECKDKEEMAKHALMDMYLLGECDHLVYSSRGGFEKMSILLSDINEENLTDADPPLK